MEYNRSLLPLLFTDTDSLVDSLTVEEMLLYTALLKRPKEEPRAHKRQEVDRLVERLALQTCRSTRIGSVLKRGISGGQAKRTNIAVALLPSPAVLFLDEPTSGLDSWTSNEVMTVVKGVAENGVTVAATIHSPSSFCFSLFDRLLVLLSGSVAYFGGTGVSQHSAIGMLTKQWNSSLSCRAGVRRLLHWDLALEALEIGREPGRVSNGSLHEI